jgi:hypothetical protein
VGERGDWGLLEVEDVAPPRLGGGSRDWGKDCMAYSCGCWCCWLLWLWWLLILEVFFVVFKREI